MDFMDPDKNWVAYDAIITTPTLTTGVDFGIAHFDMAIVSANGRSINARTLMQMIARVRTYKLDLIVVFVKGRFRRLEYADERAMKFDVDMLTGRLGINIFTENWEDDPRYILAKSFLVEQRRSAYEFATELAIHAWFAGYSVYGAIPCDPTDVPIPIDVDDNLLDSALLGGIHASDLASQPIPECDRPPITTAITDLQQELFDLKSLKVWACDTRIYCSLLTLQQEYLNIKGDVTDLFVKVVYKNNAFITTQKIFENINRMCHSRETYKDVPWVSMTHPSPSELPGMLRVLADEAFRMGIIRVYALIARELHPVPLCNASPDVASMFVKCVAQAGKRVTSRHRKGIVTSTDISDALIAIYKLLGFSCRKKRKTSTEDNPFIYVSKSVHVPLFLYRISHDELHVELYQNLFMFVNDIPITDYIIDP